MSESGGIYNDISVAETILKIPELALSELENLNPHRKAIDI